MDQIPDTNRADRIHQALQAAFATARVEVQDDSRQHAGHAGAAPGGETHYTVVVISPDFAGMGRLARSRAVHALLAAEFAGGLHALSLRLLSPEEAGTETGTEASGTASGVASGEAGPKG